MGVLDESADNLSDTFGNLLHVAVAVDGVVVPALAVVLCDRLCALVIDSESLPDCCFVIVGASAGFASVDESLYDFLFVHLEVNHDGVELSLVEQFGEGVRLVEGAGEAVEDDTLAVVGTGVEELFD